jgi:hypothetical protein
MYFVERTVMTAVPQNSRKGSALYDNSSLDSTLIPERMAGRRDRWICHTNKKENKSFLIYVYKEIQRDRVQSHI